MKIGFIGLGIMGRPMALNLKKAGHELTVPERASLTDEIRAAATVVADAKAVAAASEVVILMVPDTPDVEHVLFGAGGVAEGLKSGTLYPILVRLEQQVIGVQPLGGLTRPRVAGVRPVQVAQQHQHGPFDQHPEGGLVECAGPLQRAGGGAAVVQTPTDVVIGDAGRVG